MYQKSKTGDIVTITPVTDKYNTTSSTRIQAITLSTLPCHNEFSTLNPYTTSMIRSIKIIYYLICNNFSIQKYFKEYLKLLVKINTIQTFVACRNSIQKHIHNFKRREQDQTKHSTKYA